MALIVIVFTLWIPGAWAKWLVVIVGLIMLFHAFRCTCRTTEGTKTKPKKRKR